MSNTTANLELMPREEEKRESTQVSEYRDRQSETTAIMSVIERIAANPDADIQKLEKMLDMQERILDRNAKQQFTADLAAMQIKLPRVIEHGKGHNNAKYAKLEDINDTIRPVLQEFGFAVTFRIKSESGVMWITTVLSHRDGHSEETSIPLELDKSGSKNGVQAVGSTISYGKRYGICMMLNISTGDDVDGELPKSGPETITQEQTKTIMGLIVEAKTTTEEFCKSARISAVHNLEASRYDGAVKNLKARKEKARDNS